MHEITFKIQMNRIIYALFKIQYLEKHTLIEKNKILAFCCISFISYFCPKLYLMKKTLLKSIAFMLLVGFSLLGSESRANNIQISNVAYSYNATTPGDSANYVAVSFDVAWNNSWHTADGRYDAAWLFIRFRRGGTSNNFFQRASLSPSGNSHGSNTYSGIQVGLVDEVQSHDFNFNPAVGAFLYRTTDGTGTFTSTGVTLNWYYAYDGVADNEVVDIQVYGVEMAFIPSGNFHLGSGGTESGTFTSYDANGSVASYTISDEQVSYPIGTSSVTDIWGTSTTGDNTIGGTGSIPAEFPKGYAAFYTMKYEMSQQEYCDFLNSLTSTQAASRAYTGGLYRNGISLGTTVAANGATIPAYISSTPYVACNYISWLDGAAFADWAGLRPMTELEFEKMARGGLSFCRNEYPWGNTEITPFTSFSNVGSINEGANAGNAMYNNASGTMGPGRVGMFQSLASTRYTSGCSFYGVADLAGNVYERAVTIGNTEGRAYTGLHGNGRLSTNANADVDFWPGNNGSGGVSGEVTGATGIGLRGGAWLSSSSELRVSDRSKAAYTDATRSEYYGFRGVRSNPSNAAE
jgi:formylglycine-generating enzyme required for sulfatase activity